MRLNLRLLFMLVATGFLAIPHPANGVTVHGRLGASYYNISDDISAREYGISRYRLKFDVKNLYGKKILIKFNGSSRNKLSSDINSGIPEYRITTAKVEYRKVHSMFDVILGRDYIGEMAGARVDGIHIKSYLGKNRGIGVFAGYQPDPQDDRMNNDYTTYGAYGFLREPGYGGSIGYVKTNLKVKEDSSYFYGAGYVLPARQFSIYASSRVDRDIESGSYDITSILMNINFRLSQIARIGLGFNQYRAIKLLESMDYNLSYEMQSSFRITHVFLISETTKLRGKIETRKRSGDKANASLYEIGLRQSELWKWVFIELSYRYINYFISNITHYHLACGVEMFDAFTLELAATYSKDKPNNDYPSFRQWIYSASIDWYYTRNFYVSGRYEMSSEKFLDVESVYMKKATDEYKSNSFYLQGSYRF